MIRTLSRRTRAVLKVKDSRFIGSAAPVETEEDARAAVDALGREHPDASHCCYAYRLGTGDSALERCHDAGEPAGSAGAPILSVLKGRDLTDVAVAVVRYFGGTKLGVGGLARAYRDAARAAVEAGEIRERESRRRLGVTLPLHQAGEARSALLRMGGEVLSERYGRDLEILLAVPRSRERELRRRIDDLTRGAARWSPP